MIVRESISFERYRDPKKALGLKVEPEIIGTSDPMSIIKFMFLDKPYNLVNMGINGSNKWSVYLETQDQKLGEYINIGDIRVDDMEERIELAKKIIFNYGMGLKEYGETNIPSLDPKENAYKEKFGQQYIMDSTEDSEEDEEEKVDESIGFERYRDPKEALGLGRKVLIEEWCKTYLADYIINNDFTIDAGYVALEHVIESDTLPVFINFNKVGSFYIGYNKLTSLKGCPKEVKHDFSCSQNKLTSLEFSPEKVGGKFFCSGNSKYFTQKDVLKYCNVKKESILT